MSLEIAAVDISNTEHYRWGEVCDGWHLLKSPNLSVIQELVPPGASEVKHVHAKAHQFFYVLSGTATLEFESHSCELTAGQGVHVAAGVAHRFANRAAENVCFLVISSPTTSGDRHNLE
jgi:mannose-6-phosphate isomerase-like protein (cupin superfamily)